MKAQAQIGVLGIGAIGTVIAYHLQRNNSNVLSYFSRTKKSNLQLVSEGQSIQLPIAVKTSITYPIALDWLVICLKEHQFKNATPWFSKLIDKQTQIVVIRNGLQLKKPLLEFAEDHRILECLIDCPTQCNDNGFYQCYDTPKLSVAKSELATRFTSLLSHTNIVINQVADFKTESWKKLCESATLGAILCLHDDTCKIFKNQDIVAHYKALLTESIGVARADGALIEPGFTDKMLDKLLNYPETKGSSMLFDMRQGKPLELGAKNKVISKLGKQYQLHTPLNDFIINRLD
ncbi:2-dehydropantoate 2-reductase N-terminal domain-containing protein [uncultured Psychroserpens sp.]|uniref:2-dehydropantoate 2-reductase N-terminal domain-containing protein n=1 Tax=uncultured Psychroserpens sp. TaxID=255436 RepID=UPI00261CC693|nr:2-dehydropantoate 2-reductase N-terminal domain-containing protein [uncultured Psychroserpens sp.]